MNIAGRIVGLIWYIVFQTSYGIWFRPGDEEFDDYDSTQDTSSGVTGEVLWSWKGGK